MLFRVFLDQVTEDCMLHQFDEFAASLSSAVQHSVCSCISAAKTCRAKSVLRKKLWRSFHEVRSKELRDIWSKFYSAVKRERFDPLIEQQVNLKLFEGVLTTHFQVTPPSASPLNTSPQPQELSEEEEQIVRYAAGYVPMSLLKKHEKSESVEFVECLSKMAVNGDESSLLSYTLEWSRAINRGGLFEINDDAYRLFKEIEMKMQRKLLSMLQSSLPLPGVGDRCRC